MQYIDNHDLASKGYILVNKSNISNYNQLLAKEEEISKTKMIDMFKANHFANKDVVNLESLQEIHYILFSDIYDFAGMIRNYDISSNGYKFEHYRFLVPSTKYFIDQYIANKSIENAIELYASMNVIHPFCEGNGRATRFWFDQLLKQDFNQVVDWSNISPIKYLEAMKLSTSDTNLLQQLITSNLIDATNLDDYTFFRAIDRSYEYENLNYIKAQDLEHWDKFCPTKKRCHHAMVISFFFFATPWHYAI